jgi:LmbE family N-acetylglucosaminyl deacetylase
MSRLPRRVLALGAHPDDIELSCAGTLARYLREGCEVHLAVACLGDKGGGAGSDLALASLREEEARRSADILGAPISFLGIPDATASDTPPQREAFLRLLREVRPDLILTHGPDDYHADHVAVSDLAAKASWFCASGGHVTGQEPLARPPAVIFMDNVGGLASEPSHLVDISETFEVKRRMLACHASQTARQDGGIHHLSELMETLAQLRGFQGGVRYAEGFRPAPLWGRRRPEPLFP